MSWLLSAALALSFCTVWMTVAVSVIAVERAIVTRRRENAFVSWPGWRLLCQRWRTTAAGLTVPGHEKPAGTSAPFGDTVFAATAVALGMALLACVPGTVPIAIDLGDAGALLFLVTYSVHLAMCRCAAGAGLLAVGGAFLSVAGVMLLGGSAQFEDVASAQQRAGLWWVVTQPAGTAAFLTLAVLPSDARRPSTNGNLGSFFLADRLALLALAYAATHLYFGGFASASGGSVFQAALGHAKAWTIAAAILWARHRCSRDLSAKLHCFLAPAALGNLFVVLILHRTGIEPGTTAGLAVSFAYAAFVATAGVWNLRKRGTGRAD